MKRHTTRGSVFDDLGFDATESANLKIRAALMRALEEELDKRNLTQLEAAKLLGVSQPRISDLRRGKMHLFTHFQSETHVRYEKFKHTISLLEEQNKLLVGYFLQATRPGCISFYYGST